MSVPRATTRDMLLDAAVDCLVELGYSATTTAEIAARSGVSRGAQAYYFSNRDELILEAVRHLADRLAVDFSSLRVSEKRGTRLAREEVLDRLWELHSGPLFSALSELWVAARTEPTLRPFLKELTTEVDRIVEQSAGDGSGVEIGPGTENAVAAVRGLAMLQHLSEPAEVAKKWHRLRSTLLDRWD